jgi:hypothetical protein
MAGNVDSLVPEQPCLTRAEIGEVRRRRAAFGDEARGDFFARKRVLFGHAGATGRIGGRVGHLEQKIGA